MPAQIFFCVELPGNDQNFLPKIGPIHSFILKKYFLGNYIPVGTENRNK